MEDKLLQLIGRLANKLKGLKRKPEEDSFIKDLGSGFKHIIFHHWRILIVAVVVLSALFWMLFQVYQPLNTKGAEPIKISVQKGMSASEIAGLLKDNGLIRNRLLFEAYVLLSGDASHLKAGNYVFTGPIGTSRIAYALGKGLFVPNDITLTIFEGSNVWQIDDKLASLGLIREGDFAQKYLNKEGYLFPDTYRLQNDEFKNIGGAERVDELGIKMEANFTYQTPDILKNLDAKQQKEIIIIASILEKEVRSESDMHLVAGIIKKRLDKGMSLQVDATLAYGACLKKFNHDLNQKDCNVSDIGIIYELKTVSGYNTYLNKGLPAGPISNPGLKSIEAALHPKDSPYLYYLSTRDGTIIYSKTGAEHEANRARYLGR